MKFHAAQMATVHAYQPYCSAMGWNIVPTVPTKPIAQTIVKIMNSIALFNVNAFQRRGNVMVEWIASVNMLLTLKYNTKPRIFL